MNFFRSIQVFRGSSSIDAIRHPPVSTGGFYARKSPNTCKPRVETRGSGRIRPRVETRGFVTANDSPTHWNPGWTALFEEVARDKVFEPRAGFRHPRPVQEIELPLLARVRYLQKLAERIG